MRRCVVYPKIDCYKNKEQQFATEKYTQFTRDMLRARVCGAAN